MNSSTDKPSLRRETVETILSLGPAARAEEELALSGLFPTLPGFDSAGFVLLYVSAFPEEFETGPLLRLALALGKRVACPKVDRVARRLRLYEVKDPDLDLMRGTLGIPEPRKVCPSVRPDEVDWALVPGLAFDARCYRLGRGAGHYDRLLPTLRPDALRWALGFDCQWVDELPVEPHDVRLDGVVSRSRRAVRQSF